MKVIDTQYGIAAVDAFNHALLFESDFPGWLAAVLATVAASHQDGSYSIIASRPCSWEAHYIRELLRGTVGEEDEHLDAGKPAPNSKQQRHLQSLRAQLDIPPNVKP